MSEPLKKYPSEFPFQMGILMGVMSRGKHPKVPENEWIELITLLKKIAENFYK